LHHFMIAPSGEVFAPTPLNFYHCCDLPPTDRPLHEYAIKNAGVIEVKAENATLWITARPRLVTREGVYGLVKLARSRRLGKISRVVLVLLTPERQGDLLPPQIFPAATLAVETLVARCKEMSVDPSWSEFSLSRFRLEGEVGRAYDSMKAVVAEWRLSGGRMDDEQASGFLARAVGGANIMIARVSPDHESIVMEQEQMVSLPWTTEWWRRNRNDFRHHPDQRYARWILPQYKEVIFAGRPRADRVSVHVRSPETGAKVANYDRLLLPWRRRDGTSVATLVSVMREIKAG
jgi:hypothetical protein